MIKPHLIGIIANKANIKGGSYVTAKRNQIIEVYKQMSKEYGLEFSENHSVKSPDSTTLFTTSGMQQFKKKFKDESYSKTFTNIQRCLRLNDLEEIGDSTHYLDFHMIGLFSFRQWTIQEGVDFFMKFLERIGLSPDTVTIHPDKFLEWQGLYKKYPVKIEMDNDCKWSDGSIGGYCTEFYIQGVEIGNIVNTLGTCLDIGFGLERLENILKGNKINSKLKILERTIECLEGSGTEIDQNKEGYVLKKLIIKSLFLGSKRNSPNFVEIKRRQVINFKVYLKNKKKRKYQGKDEKFWLDTFGIDETCLDYYEKITLEQKK